LVRVSKAQAAAKAYFELCSSRQHAIIDDGGDASPQNFCLSAALHCKT